MQYLIDRNYWLHCFKYFSFRYKTAAVQRVYYTDGIYEGQVNRISDDRVEMHGIGIFLTNRGDTCFGEFKHNHLDGEANLLMSNGSFFRGRFQNGVYQGLGVFIDADRDVYLLNFKKGQINGRVTYFPTSSKEVFILNFEGNKLRKVHKRYRLSTEQGDEAKYRVLKSVFENSQLNEILYTATDVRKIIKKVSKSPQKFINSQMIGKEFLYCGVFNDEMEFEGLGLLLDIENKKIRIGDWTKQSLNGFGILIQAKYMFKGHFQDNQLDGEILITNLETDEYKLCLYDKGMFKTILKDGKGNYPYKGFEYPASIDAAKELANVKGSKYMQESNRFGNLKKLGSELTSLKLKVPLIEDFLNSKGIDLKESQILIAIKHEEMKKHKSKSPYQRTKPRGYDNSNNNSEMSKDTNMCNSRNRTDTIDMLLENRQLSFKYLQENKPKFIQINPDNFKFSKTDEEKEKVTKN